MAHVLAGILAASPTNAFSGPCTHHRAKTHIPRVHGRGSSRELGVLLREKFGENHVDERVIAGHTRDSLHLNMSVHEEPQPVQVQFASQ